MPHRNATDATVHLLAKYKAGDDQAGSLLYDRYFDRIHAVVRLRMGPRLRAKAESLDIVQEAFLASLRRLEDFTCRTEGDFFHWLCTITENRIRDEADRFRAKKRDPGRERPLQVRRPSRDSLLGPISELAGGASPATQVIRDEDLHRLERAIDELPQLQREALLQVRYEGQSLQEVAQRIGRSPDAVRMLVARAIVALGKHLGEAGST